LYLRRAAQSPLVGAVLGVAAVRHGVLRVIGARPGSAAGARSSQWKTSVALSPPAICASTKPGTSMARMPVKVAVSAHARVSAGLANDVDAVNQYPAVI